MKITLAILLLFAVNLYAQQINAAPLPKIGAQVSVTLKSGEKQSGKLAAIDPDSISLLDSDGGARINFADMSPSDQQAWHYDPAKAADFVQQQSDAAAQEKLLQKAAILKQVEYDAKIAADKAWKARLAASRPMVGEVFQKTKEGIMLSLYAGRNPQSGQFESSADDQLVFVTGLQGDFHPNEVISFTAISDGTLTYTTVEGLTNTVAKYLAISGYSDIDNAPAQPVPVKSHFTMDEAAHSPH